MVVTAVFLDIDVVWPDTDKLSAEYQCLMGDVLAAALGGTPEDWGRANAAVYGSVFAEVQAWEGEPMEIFSFEYTTSIRRMCAWLDIQPPAESECARLGRAFNIYVRRNVDSIFPAAADVVRTLAGSFDVHLATGNLTWLGEAVLNNIGVRDLIGVPAGPDLVERQKGTPGFYLPVLRLAAADPATSVVVDDVEHVLTDAHAAGARTVLVAPPSHEPEPHIDRVISNISELPEAIRRIATG